MEPKEKSGRKILNVMKSVALLPVYGSEALVNGSKIHWNGHKIDRVEEIHPDMLATTETIEGILCPSGEDSVGWRRKLICGAQVSLEIAGSYCGGKPFDEFLTLFSWKLAENDEIIIRLLTGPMSLSKDQKRRIKLLQRIYATRFEAVIAKNTWEIFPKLKMREQHAKMLIADKHYFVIGGNNLNNWQLPQEHLEGINYRGTLGLGRMLDMDIVGRGAETGEKLKRVFDDLWLNWKGDLGIAPNEPVDRGFQEKSIIPHDFFSQDVRLVGDCSIHVGGAHQGKDNHCERVYVRAIDSAFKTIYISNMAFNQKRIVQAVREAIERGVNVEIISNGISRALSIPARIQGMRNSKYFRVLVKLDGVNVSLHVMHKSFLHTKVMVVDEETMLIGSMNIDKKSTRCDDEILLEIKSQQIALEALEHLRMINGYAIEFQDNAKIVRPIEIMADKLLDGIL